jgi:group II intron reverse transcriptase/maturase
MTRTPTLDNVSTKLERIAELARQAPTMAMRTLAHHIDVEFLHAAYQRTRKDGAVGVDEQTAAEYEEQLETNLRSLLDRFKSGTYHAPPVRRVHIPKSDGATRPIGVPTFEDKVLQRAVAMVLNAIYEQDFKVSSYGFRPGRSAHGALQALWDESMRMRGGWVLEVDIRRFFDSVDHRHLRAILDQRVRDGVIRRAIDKWLQAGVLEAGTISYPGAGTPQGGVISPLLANVYLHEVLDVWFETEVQPRLGGKAFLVRYADDFVITFAGEADARRVMAVLSKRFEKYGLALHPEKTRLVDFRRPLHNGRAYGSFTLLGFTHYWGRARSGSWVIQRKTSSPSLGRSLQQVAEWCRGHRHLPIREQHEALARKLRGHYGYFGIVGNSRSLGRFFHEAKRVWRKWLDRRSNNARMNWNRFKLVLVRHPLPRPRIVHRLVANPVV